MLALHPKNPFRPVSWRWERGLALRDGKLPRREQANSDRWTLRALSFQTRLSKCRNDSDRYELMTDDPDMYSAYLIHVRGEDEDRHPMRFVIEARLLAGQDGNTIADRLGLEPVVVNTYERVFFNVKEKLKNTDYIMTSVIGPAVHAGMTERDYDLLWKLFGYMYGPAALDAFISTTTRQFKPQSVDEIDALLAEDARSSLQRKVAIAARTFMLNPFSQSELLNVYARFLEMEKDSGGEKNRDVILQNIQIMLDKLPFAVGAVTGPSALINKLDASGTELTTRELLKLTADGDDGTVLDPAIETLQFPEVNKNGRQTK